MSLKTGRFSRTNRINNPKDYQQVFKSSCRSADDRFLVIARKNSLKQARLGLAISKKNINRATSRNQTKRVIRESFRQNKDKLTGLDVVVISRKKQNSVNSRFIFESITSHWIKISECRKF